MKQLSESDIEQMCGAEFTVPVSSQLQKQIRSELKLSTRIPKLKIIPPHQVLDLHLRTEQESWDLIMSVAKSGSKSATIITGASGILKIKFQQWAQESILTQYISSYTALNNGSFEVKFKKLT